MSRWCFVHAADLHLDTPFDGVGKVDGTVAQRLRDASLAAFDDLVQLALDRDAVFVVLAGDVYDGPERGLRAQLRFESGLRRLDAAGIATFVAHGNHDPVATGWQLVTAWPPTVRVFGSDDVEAVEVRRDGEVVAVVEGVSYAERAESRNLARRFARTELDVLHVGVLHANVGDDRDHAPYAPCTVDDLRVAGIDYWALGHVHRRTTVLDGTGGDPWAVYPGNLQGRSVRRTERGEKGASVVHVADGAIDFVEHVTLDRARFDVVAATIDGSTTLGELQRVLAEGVEEAVAGAGDRVVVLRLDVDGRGPAHLELARSDAAGELVDAVRDRVRGATAVVVTGLRDRSAPPAGELDPTLSSLVDEVDDTEVVGEAVAAARGRRWTEALPEDAELAAAARAAARTLLAPDRR